MHWEDYDVVFLTPDGAMWDPHSLHFAEEEAAMVDADGAIVQRVPCPTHHLLTAADLSEMYADNPVSWDAILAQVDACLEDDNDTEIGELTDVDIAHFLAEELQSQRAHDRVLDPDTFSQELYTIAMASVKEMALGSVTVGNLGCELFDAPDGDSFISAVTAGKPGGVSAERLAKLFSIPFDDAARTLAVTTQLNRQTANSSLSRNFETKDQMVRYKQLNSTFFTDTMYVTAKAKSTRENTCAQLFVSNKALLVGFPMRDTKSYLNLLKIFAKEVGAPRTLICNAHPTQTKREVRDFLVQFGTTLRVLEANTQWANRAELYVGLLKEAIRKDMRETNSPLVLWDYCLERRVLIFQVTAKKLFQLNGTNPHTATFGMEADILHLCQFGWYEWVYYQDQSASFPFPKECLGRCLGLAKNEGNAMTQWILNENGRIVVRRSIWRLTPHELSPSNESEVVYYFNSSHFGWLYVRASQSSV